ncbi:MAG TPA: CHAT domain-containing protein [Longimicrobium sp.]|nr:CHAT domain-containing protein [Longimicrobium sp.]
MRLIAAAAVALLVEGGGAAPYGIGSPRGPEAILLGERFTTGRLTGQSAWQPCVPEPGEALVPRVRCGEPLARRTRRFVHLDAAARNLRRRLAAADSAGQRRAHAIWLLRRGNEVDRSVAELERAAARAPDDAGVLNDLAVAYLEQGARDQTLEPVLRALDAVERAVARDSTRVEALYNRALVAERLYLANTARDAWTRYAAMEPDPRWRAEARARARALQPRGDTLPWAGLVDGPALDPGARRARIAARVRRSPSDAREFSITLLGRWGAATLAGHTAQAERLLAWAREIGGAAERLGGDRTVALAVRAIDAPPRDPARIRDLAAAHVALDSGRAEFRSGRHEAAEATLRGAERALAEHHSAFAGWAAYLRAASLISSARYDAADTLLRRVAGDAERGQPALAGRATWALGTSRVRRGLYDEAGAWYRAARPYLQGAGEREYLGTLHYLLSESLGLAGQHAAARTEAYQGLRALFAFPSSTYYASQLSAAAAEARSLRLHRAALALMRERVAVVRASGPPDLLAQTLRAQARARMALGDTAGARADLRDALRQVAKLKGGAGRLRTTADVMVAQAEMVAGRDPRAALATLTQAISAYRRLQLGVYVPATLSQAAAAARRAGERDSARALVDEAVRQLETLQDSARTAETRASSLEASEVVFDQAMTLAMEERRFGHAFAYLERARAAAWPRGAASAGAARRARPADPGTVAAGIAPGTLLLEYAVLPDRVVIWAISPRGARTFAAAVPRDSVAWLAERFAADGYRAGGAPGAALFGLLLRPVAAELAGVRQLAIVPDRELNQVPFAALRDPRAPGLMVEAYALRTLPSAAFFLAARARKRAAPHPGPALVIGDPATDPALRLDPLPGAAAEAQAVARLRHPSILLVGPQATRGALLRDLSRASVLHFAGHAVFNAEQPELSYLALAPGGPGGPGILRAWEIGHLAATNLETVVLSACSTLSPRPSHAGAPAGLAYSFLRAGAPATVSTLWDVRDQTTTPVLVEFHRRVAAGTPAAEALRQAQVAALRSSRSAVRAPEAWAALIYTGP